MGFPKGGLLFHAAPARCCCQTVLLGARTDVEAYREQSGGFAGLRLVSVYLCLIEGVVLVFRRVSQDPG